ncbi:MAG: GNAT family N-acetyltransferase [Gammaproteobacteria bacterium]
MPDQVTHSAADAQALGHAIDAIRQVAQDRNHRALVVLSGTAAWCQTQADLIAESPGAGVVEWPGRDGDEQASRKRHFIGKLGGELDTLIVPLPPGFDANRLAALSGMIRGGGLLVLLLTPELWNSVSRFDQRFIHTLHQPGIHWLQQNKPYRSASVAPATSSPGHELCLHEQHEAVAQLLQLHQSQARFAVVLHSDRGRGKSAALGQAAAHWLAAGEDVYLTGPSLASVAQVFRHAQAALATADLERGCLRHRHHVLQFLPPDVVHSHYAKIKCLLVDEAAAIPIPKLSDWLQHIPQLVFATTIHGYEGTGKGFLLKFAKVLQQYRPDGQTLTLQQPIRWARDDVLEHWLNQTFLLQCDIELHTSAVNSLQDTGAPLEAAIDKGLAAEYRDSGFATDSETSALSFVQNRDRQAAAPAEASGPSLAIQRYHSADLANDEALLQQIYGLLVNAHYRTTPKDLRYLLDSDAACIDVLWQGQQLLAAAWVIYEGDFEPMLADAVYLGTRRPPGHLLAQSLSYHCAIREAATYRYARIVRLAVHPQHQRQGLGSRLVQDIIRSETAVDAIGASFSASIEGLDFWQKNHFTPVRIGMSRHQASGEHSVMVLHPVSETGQVIMDKARQRMLDALSYHLEEPLADLDQALVSRLTDAEVRMNPALTADDWQELVLFAYAHRTYAEALGPLVKLAGRIATDNRLSTLQQKVLRDKVLAHQDWESVVRHTGVAGQKQGLQILRQAVRDTLPHYGPASIRRNIDWVCATIAVC